MTRLKNLTLPRPSTAGLHPRWQATLARLEERVLALANEIADALERHGEKNLFDLIAATNALLDLLDRLHERAHIIQRHTEWTHIPPEKRLPVKTPLEVPEDYLLGTNGPPQ